MNIAYYEDPVTGNWEVYDLQKEDYLKKIGSITKHKNYYTYRDYVFNDAWEDIDLMGLMYELGRYYC